MSLVYKCDRCGVILPDEGSVPRRLVHTNFVRGSIMFNSFVTNKSNANNVFKNLNREITLCKECDESFVHWFMSGKKE